jgi:integrase
MVVLALNTGMRKSEVLNLRWADVLGDELTIKGKREKTRAIPLNVEARKAIERQPRRDQYAFWLANRNQLANLRRTVDLIRKRTGVDFHFHLLRHRFSTSLLEKGVDIVTVSELLGHSKAMTSLIYSHTDSKRKRKAVDLLGG